jgi:nitroreductase
MNSLQSIEVLNAIYQRRAIRLYKSEPMRRESLVKLLDAAAQAPSAMNEQPWAFVIILGRERLAAYSKRVKQYLLKLVDGPFPHPIGPLIGSANIFYDAPALVLICATSGDAQAAEDCCLAAENFMLAAFSEGFGTCPIGCARPWLSLDAIKNEIGIPQEWTPVVPVIVGRPDEDPPPPGRRPVQSLWAGESPASLDA